MQWTDGTAALGLDKLAQIDPCLLWQDLDADGQDELITIAQPTKPFGYRSLVVGWNKPADPSQPQGKPGLASMKLQTTNIFIDGSVLDCAAGDLDGDGKPELALAMTQGVAILRLTGKEFGKNVTKQFVKGLDKSAHTLSLFDFDGDGDQDMYVGTNVNGGESSGMSFTCGQADGVYAICCITKTPDECMSQKSGQSDIVDCCTQSPATAAHHLLRNDGGKFTDVGPQMGIDGGVAMTLTARDIDRDGRMDLFVGDDFGHHGWYINGGDHFDFQGTSAGMRPYSNVMGSVVADFDLDHHDDLVVTNWGASTYYRGSDAEFVDDSAKWNVWPLTQNGVCWAELGADLDNDGWVDMFTTFSGEGDAAGVSAVKGGWDQPNPLVSAYHLIFHNVGGTFTSQKIPWPATGASTVDGTVTAAADLDHDGDLDLLVETPPGILTVWLNDTGTTPQNHWLEVRPTQGKTPVAGALVQIWRDGYVQERWLEHSGGFGAHQALSARFGLGQVDKLDLVRIWWPWGEVTELQSPDLDQVLTVDHPPPTKP